LLYFLFGDAELLMTPYAEVAVAFASALVDEDFARAEALLAPELRRHLTPEALRENLYAMFRGYAEGDPRTVHFDEEFQLQEWPNKLPDDVGWVYVGIEGDDFVEAVSVVVAEVNGELFIRKVDWGRP
jgi:hypothetical protein